MGVCCVQEVGVKATLFYSLSDTLRSLTLFVTPPQAYSNDLCAEPLQHFCLDSTGGQELLSYIRRSAQVSQKTASQHPWVSEGALVCQWEDVSGFICSFFSPPLIWVILPSFPVKTRSLTSS